MHSYVPRRSNKASLGRRGGGSHIFKQMARWVRPEVYPLMAAMTFVTGLCVFQLTRNMFLNPDVRINKAHRTTAVLENAEEGRKYSQHSFRKFLSQRPPEVMPALNSFFSNSDKQ